MPVSLASFLSSAGEEGRRGVVWFGESSFHLTETQIMNLLTCASVFSTEAFSDLQERKTGGEGILHFTKNRNMNNELAHLCQ